MIVPLRDGCWKGRHGTRIDMSRDFLLESDEDVDGWGQTCSPPDTRPSLGCLSFVRGVYPTNSQLLPALGFGLAVVQLAGAVDYPGPGAFSASAQSVSGEYSPNPSPKPWAAARQTQRTRDSLLELSHCSSAEMAARVARLLGFATSADSLIRLQRLERFPVIFPRVLGVDEFALRKGRTYGTLMVDLERRVPVDIFEGIAAKDLTA